MTQVALIGAGRMGLPIGRRLLAAEHELTVMDLDPAPVRALVEAGATAAATPGEAAAAAQLTFVSLPRPEIVESVVLAPAGVIACAAAGSAVVDLSTGSPALARRMFETGRLRGVDILDAPVSGGPLGARAGTLAIMVGGAPDAFRRVQPVLEAFGDTIRHMGPAGAGQVTKLANNMLAAAQMAALAEAVALAHAEHLDPARMYEVISGASGDSSVLQQRFPAPGVLAHAPASNDWAALFPVDLMIKDVLLALDAAAVHGLKFPVTTAAEEQYRAAQDAGWGGLDFSTVARLRFDKHQRGSSANPGPSGFAMRTVIDVRSAERLRSTPLAWLTTVRGDGQPQTSYIWFHYDGNDIVLLSQPNTSKLRNIDSNPRVSINLDGDTATGGGVLTLEATAEIIGEMAGERWTAYVAKYESRIRNGPWGTPDGFLADFSTAIRLVPVRLRAW